ncbi:transglycosylase domain-containing protein [Hymenobacter lapidiphilus]|uniref:Transglycosylase domain-containing protein n=1 Tax=Hymenobacter lapidiphilus TaxID=2608003 RepID=A0A7Y7PNV4_9BACT|nr:biosynthetic peptidoglycan transglycosylase [Hymenobacter lapidiphilus]NVO31205.1 transglycosylase domain-containing protein [Hymenobacter lapidiphilus]
MHITPVIKKRIGIGLGILAVLLLAGLGLFLVKRQQLLEAALVRVKAKVEAKFPVTLTLGPARFTDLNTVELRGISVVPTAPLTDTLLRARTVRASLSVRSLFAGRPVFSNLEIDTVRLTARQTANGTDNYSFLYKKKKGAPTVVRDTTKGTNYGLLANQLLEATFDNVPDEADFREFFITYDGPRHRARLVMPRLAIKSGEISGEMTALIDSVENRVGVTGSIDAGSYEVDAQVFGLDKRPVVLPFVQRRYGARVQFDTIRVSLSDKTFRRDELTLTGTASAVNFIVNHPKLSDQDVRFPRGGIDFVTRLGQASFALEKGTRVLLNRMEFFPELSVRRRPVPERVIGKNINGLTSRSQALAGMVVNLDVESSETKANDFFEALPEGMFETLEGTRAEGTLQYKLHAALDMNQVDSLEFDSSLRATKFRITRFGRENLNKLNESFLYTAYNDKGDSVKVFKVGPENPEFTPYNQVSDYLKYAIMTAEDPRFMTHRGFMEKAFVKSAIQNLKERRFARGGSTLSMQLVKNVFLTRKKTIVRKVEEALIVWIIENTRLASKQRMLEVYLNIIEWGPRIYGVHEAADFYFDKSPANLNLSESLYLASIIPSPKRFRAGFNQYGDLRGSSRYFRRLIAQLMARRGYISESESESVGGVSFSGSGLRAMNFSARPDTTRLFLAPDSTRFDEPIDLLDLLGTDVPPSQEVPIAPAVPPKPE